MLLLAIALQVAADTPERFSVLTPALGQRCAAADEVVHDDIVVCAQGASTQALPLPNDATSPLPQPVNRDKTGIGALAAQSTPCAARIGGCQVGVDMLGGATSLVRGIHKLVAPNSCCEEPGEATNTGKLAADVVGGVGRIFRHKPDTSNRVPIDLDEPDTTGKVLP